MENNNNSPSELFDLIIKDDDLGPIINRKFSYKIENCSRIIILLEDRHSIISNENSESDYKKIRILNQRYGIRSIGSEHFVNREPLLFPIFGELEIFNKYIVNNNNFYFFPLESSNTYKEQINTAIYSSNVLKNIYIENIKNLTSDRELFDELYTEYQTLLENFNFLNQNRYLSDKFMKMVFTKSKKKINKFTSEFENILNPETIKQFPHLNDIYFNLSNKVSKQSLLFTQNKIESLKFSIILILICDVSIRIQLGNFFNRVLNNSEVEKYLGENIYGNKSSIFNSRFPKILKNIILSLSPIGTKISPTDDNRPVEKKKLFLNNRDKDAVNILKEEMLSNNIYRVISFYGARHTRGIYDGIIELNKKQNFNCSIITIKSNII